MGWMRRCIGRNLEKKLFRFPSHFPKLEKPNLIIATPIWFQISFILLITFISIGLIAWTLLNINSLNLLHFIALAISFWLLYGVFSKKTRERWFGFAADINGVYLGNKNRLLIFIPWENVGDTYVVNSENFGTKLVTKIKIDENSWNSMPDLYSATTPQPSECMDIDKDGFRHITIGNYILSTRYKLRKIALIRQLAQPLK